MELNEILTHHDRYDIETRTYTHRRESGLYSILNWAVRQICLLELSGHKVDKVKLILNEYINETDCFDSLFYINGNQISFDDITEEEKNNFINSVGWSYTGFGSSPKEIDLRITNKIISKFFNPTREVLGWYTFFTKHLGGNLNDVVFIWARKTDKISETRVPSVDTYLKYLTRIDTRNKKILVQSDDLSVLNEFSQRRLHFYTLPKLSPSKRKNNAAFHINLRDVSDQTFMQNYGVTKIDHLRQMVALSLIAKNASTTILYPGNPSTFLPLYKGSFDRFLLFKNDLSLF